MSVRQDDTGCCDEESGEGIPQYPYTFNTFKQTVSIVSNEYLCSVLLLVRTTGDNIHAQGLQSTNIFRDARSEAEQEIYKRLNAKVDEFLELASYDWTLDESKGHASGYIQDVISFLEGSFKAFKHLPVREGVFWNSAVFLFLFFSNV